MITYQLQHSATRGFIIWVTAHVGTSAEEGFEIGPFKTGEEAVAELALMQECDRDTDEHLLED